MLNIHSVLLLLSAVVVLIFAQDDVYYPERCDSPIYCESNLLKTVQLAALYPDSKTFVDKVCHDNAITISMDNLTRFT